MLLSFADVRCALLDRSVYPHLEIYPGAPMSNVYTNVVVSLSPEEKSYYPAIDLCKLCPILEACED